MQHWEYHTALLYGVVVNLINTKGWRLRAINEQEQHDWKKTEIYPTVVDFCNRIGQQGWELTSAGYPRHETSEVILYFKRPLPRTGLQLHNLTEISDNKTT